MLAIHLAFQQYVTFESFKHTAGKFLNPSESFSSWEFFPDGGPGRQPNIHPGIEYTFLVPLKQPFTKCAFPYSSIAYIYNPRPYCRVVLLGSKSSAASSKPFEFSMHFLHISLSCVSVRFSTFDKEDEYYITFTYLHLIVYSIEQFQLLAVRNKLYFLLLPYTTLSFTPRIGFRHTRYVE